MDLITTLLTLPLAPVRGVVAVAEVIRREVDRQMYDPTQARRELQELDEEARAGRLSAQERDRAQQQVLDRLITRTPAATPGPNEEA